MKKLLNVMLVGMLLLTLSGCGNEATETESKKESKKEDVITTKTCTMDNDAFDITFKFNATNDKVNEVELIMAYDNKAFGVETLSDLTDDQKDAMKKNVLTTLGLDSEKEGITANVVIEDAMTVTVKGDLDVADQKALKAAGIDVEAGSSLKELVEEMKDEGVTCN